MSIQVDHGRRRLPGATVSIPFAVLWQSCDIVRQEAALWDRILQVAGVRLN
ncbi:hypothetical protein [Bordetella bronchialis]|uniref:hypothetical protein n=1 Tax=Bordetella bronchialis TaxID=463025 RepID=UPI000A92FEDD|nr:hypothetical protein [Bordetella bronchialis]